MRITTTFIVFLFVLSAAKAQSPAGRDAKMNAYISGLMGKMTLEEKIGQLNLPGAGDITTGQAANSDIARKIEQGEVGGFSTSKPSRRSRMCNGSPWRKAG